MKEPLFHHLRAGRSGCPSDFVLDRLVAEELPEAQAARTREHLATCAACTEHVQNSRFDALPQVNAAALLSRVRAAASERPKRLRDRLRGFWPGRMTMLTLSGAASLAVLLLMVYVRPFGDGPVAGTGFSGLRAKGGLSLHVHRMVHGDSQEVLSGVALFPGERLRFSIDLPREGYVTILGIESGGGMYTAWPTAGSVPERRPAGRGQILPGAVALDDAPGQETLYLVLCPATGEPPRCQPGGGQKPPRCPAGCGMTPFVIDKARH
jgi:hypothetical protein